MCRRAHVVEKVTQWHAENDRKLEGSLKFDDWLCVRLGAGNTRRREQLMYWQRHPEQGSSMKIHAETLPLGRSASQKFAVDPATVSVAPTLGNTIAHNTPASEFTAQSFSVVARSVLKDTATISGRPKTTYAASDYRPEATEIRVPDFPKAEKGAVTVPCPYCFTQLNVKEMGNQRELWKYVHSFSFLFAYSQPLGSTSFEIYGLINAPGSIVHTRKSYTSHGTIGYFTKRRFIDVNGLAEIVMKVSSPRPQLRTIYEVDTLVLLQRSSFQSCLIFVREQWSQTRLQNAHFAKRYYH